MSELDFAAEVLPKSVRILAVTGSNGKSTVVTFAGQVLFGLVILFLYHIILVLINYTCCVFLILKGLMLLDV